MTAHLTQPCAPCNGAGLVPRAQRRLPNGEPDQFDNVEWPQVICDACNGSGRVPLDHSTIAETTAP